MEQRKRAKPNTPERYLWRKPGARHLWFRLAVPVRFQRVEARKIVQQSLGTTDRKVASVLAAQLRVRLTREWEAKLGTGANANAAMPTEADLHRAAALFGYSRTDQTIADWWSEARTSDESCYRNFVESLGQRRRRYLEQRDTAHLDLWRYVADNVAAEYGWTLPDAIRDRLGHLVAEAVIDRLGVEIELRNGNFAAEPTSKIVRAGLAPVEAAAADETIMALFERYAEQRLAEKRKREDTINQDRIIVRQFASFIGDARKVAGITQAEVREWRDTIASLPPSYSAAKAYKGLSLREAAAKARATGAAKLSPTTVNKYLSTVSPFLGWCVRNGYAERNPCDGLFYDLVKGRNPRPPFSSEQLNEIFGSSLFVGFEADGREHLPGKQRAEDWRFWIPLVCLFTGARISEIAQLRTDDLEFEGGTPYLLIREDESRGQRTKSARSRIAPMHPQLVQLGFVRFIKRREEPESSDTRLFPDLNPVVHSSDLVGRPYLAVKAFTISSYAAPPSWVRTTLFRGPDSGNPKQTCIG